MVIFGRNRLRLRQRAPFPWTRSRRLSVLSAQVLKNAGRLRCPDPSSLLSINSSGCSRASDKSEGVVKTEISWAVREHRFFAREG